MAFRRKRLIKTEDELSSARIDMREKPKKGWGKKERSFVFLVVIGTSLTAFLLAFTSRQGKLPGLPRLSGSSIGMSETVVLTKTQAPPSVKKKQNETILAFTEAVSQLSGVYSFVAVDLNSGEVYGVNEYEPMQAASLIKLPVMAQFLKMAEDGKINLDTVYTLRDADKIGGSGSLQYKAAGTELTYRELVQLMGKQSDNTAFNVVRKKIGDQAIADYMKNVGMKNTDLLENMTTPSDMALLFEKIYQAQIISVASRDLLLESLTGTIYEQHLVKGIPEGIKVAHKYGRELHVVNDGGVVYSESPYVVVIMTAGIVEAEADSVFPKLSQIIFEGQTY